MKYLRPGYTESTLLFIDYLLKNNIKIENHTQSGMINWLYTTSGFYDRDFSGSYFDFDTKNIATSDNFIKFINEYRNSLMNSDKLHLLLHRVCSEEKTVNKFIHGFQPKDDFFWWNYKLWYKILENKSVLLISSFAPLMEQQYVSGNLFKIDPQFPRLANITHYQTPYTFFNSGPNKNFFETLEQIKQQISIIHFDIAIIACGAYAVFLADYCDVLGKIAIAIGSRMHYMWGIDTTQKENSLWISDIPQEYIPEGHEKIENSRYWK